jgi:hypothetical protein
MARQSHHESNQHVTVRTELVEGLINATLVYYLPTNLLFKIQKFKCYNLKTPTNHENRPK